MLAFTIGLVVVTLAFIIVLASDKLTKELDIQLFFVLLVTALFCVGGIWAVGTIVMKLGLALSFRR